MHYKKIRQITRRFLRRGDCRRKIWFFATGCVCCRQSSFLRRGMFAVDKKLAFCDGDDSVAKDCKKKIPKTLATHGIPSQTCYLATVRSYRRKWWTICDGRSPSPKTKDKTTSVHSLIMIICDS
mgnify:CR=1 FL=1